MTKKQSIRLGWIFLLCVVVLFAGTRTIRNWRDIQDRQQEKMLAKVSSIVEEERQAIRARLIGKTKEREREGHRFTQNLERMVDKSTADIDCIQNEINNGTPCNQK